LFVYACSYGQGWQVQYELAFYHTKNFAAWDSISAARNGKLQQDGMVETGQFLNVLQCIL